MQTPVVWTYSIQLPIVVDPIKSEVCTRCGNGKSPGFAQCAECWQWQKMRTGLDPCPVSREGHSHCQQWKRKDCLTCANCRDIFAAPVLSSVNSHRF